MLNLNLNTTASTRGPVGPAPIPIPVVDFSASTTGPTAGDAVTFTDLSTNSPTSWEWSFPGGTPTGSTGQNPTITYSATGSYDVTLLAGNTGGTGSLTKTDYIDVQPAPSLLLDDYPGAEGAYSTRLLSSVYVGNAIRVRRASDNAESDIGFVGEDLDQTSLTTFCSGTNGFVTTWYDQSGNGNNATQSSATEQPKIYDSATGITEINGKPAMYYDGTDSLDANALATSFSGTDKYISAFTVADSDMTVTTNKAFWSFGRSTTSIELRWLGVGTDSLNVIAWGQRDSASVVDTLQGGSMANQTLTTIISNMDNNEIFENGTSVASNTISMGATTLNRFAFGCLSRSTKNIFIEGWLQEMIIYQSNESTDRTGIESNVTNYFSI